MIEIERNEAFGISDADLPGDDATLDALFARLVGHPAIVQSPTLSRRPATQRQPAGGSQPPVVLTANLGLLAADLNKATRELVAGLFLNLGSRGL